jgi:hypothetical protein
MESSVRNSRRKGPQLASGELGFMTVLRHSAFALRARLSGTIPGPHPTPLSVIGLHDAAQAHRDSPSARREWARSPDITALAFGEAGFMTGLRHSAFALRTRLSGTIPGHHPDSPSACWV